MTDPPKRQRKPMFTEAEIRRAACEVLHTSFLQCQTDDIIDLLKEHREEKRKLLKK
jgi:hypothetical protein